MSNFSEITDDRLKAWYDRTMLDGEEDIANVYAQELKYRGWAWGDRKARCNAIVWDGPVDKPCARPINHAGGHCYYAVAGDEWHDGWYRIPPAPRPKSRLTGVLWAILIGIALWVVSMLLLIVAP